MLKKGNTKSETKTSSAYCRTQNYQKTAKVELRQEMHTNPNYFL